MDSRGQKRPESSDELPVDKRPCSSMGNKPSSSNQPPQIVDNASKTDSHVSDMEASSASHRPDDHSERDDDSPYSTDNDDYNEDAYENEDLARVQRERSLSDQEQITGLIPILNNHSDPSAQLVSLTQLCEVLSFSTGDSFPTSLADQLASALVRLANHENNSDIMLLAMRAITYYCDVSSVGLTLLVRHDVVPALCRRLIVVEYLDVAEQCFQALKKISRSHPHVCLQSGAIMAVLGFLDFFSTNIQRTALSTVVNICNKLPSNCPAPAMGAISKLCDLLQYEDQQLVESAITCLIKIADRVKDSPEYLKELCKHGLVQHTVHLIGVKNQRSLSQTTYSSLIGLLAKLVAVSTDAVSMIFELDIGSTLKDYMSNYDPSHGMLPHTDEKHSNQLHEFLRFLNELLPPTRRQQEDQLLSAKEKIFADHPDGLRKFGMQVLPFLIQVGNSGENLSVCYGFLSVISKLVYHSNPEMLFEMIENTGMPSFLMSVFARKDHHILALALEITEMVLQKLSDTVMPSLAKEGVFFAIDALLTPEKCSMFMSPSANGISTPDDFSHQKCLCYVYSTKDHVSTSETKACKLDKDSVQEVAKRIREKYSLNSVDTDLLQNLREASCELNSLINDIKNGGCRQSEEKLNSMLHRVMELISGDEPISTFELIESGITKALMNYLYVGLYEGEEVDLSNVSVNFDLVLERFKVFARLSLSSLNPTLKDLPLCLLVQKLQVAVSTMDRFPLTSDNKARPRTYASIPHGRHVAQSCLRVCFKREELEKDLGEYSEALKTVDPFCSVEAIKSYLYPKIAKKDTGILKTAKLPDMEEETEKTIQTANLASMDIDEPKSVGKIPCGFTGSEYHHPMEVDDESESSREGTSSECSSSMEGSQSDVCNDTGCDFSRITIYLEGSELHDSSTLYHKVLQQRMKSKDDIYSGADVWSEVYTLTYKIAADSSNKRLCQQYFPFSYDIVVPEIISGTVRSSPTNDIVFLLRSLEIINRYAPHLGCSERVDMFARGKCNDLHSKSMIPKLSQNEFVNSKLSEKLEQQMRNPLTVSIAAMPFWCNWLICTCPFLFTLGARRSFFQLAACGRSYSQSHSPRRDSVSLRKKFLVSRDHILESATRMMEEEHVKVNTILEVEYQQEVGTGLGPILEFYTLVCHEFQKPGLGMWREDYHHASNYVKSDTDSGSKIVTSSLGLFPRPWSKNSDVSDVIKRFSLLGWTVAKALQDGRVLDIPFSKAFFKLILGQDLSLYDIQSFDPVFGKTLLEFHAIISRQTFQIDAREEDLTFELDLRFRGTRVEDLYLDFTLPGYPDYALADEEDHSRVTIGNLKEYVSLVVDATLNAGIYRQAEAFKSGFNKVFPISHLRIFNEEELEHLLCGECDSWVSTDLLDHCKIDHGYTASSTHILYLMEIIQDFSYEQRRAFLQFVTGAPRLPPGGLSALNPKLTIVRKISSNFPDSDLPSVMTCTNYLKLPPYSSKEMMREKLLYAITEGQGAFHLS